MTKDQLAEEVVLIAHKTNSGLGISTEIAKACINATMAAITQAVVAGEKVDLRRFGTFGPKKRAAKVARNIAAGTQMAIPAHMIPVFEPSDEFKAKVRGSESSTVNQ